MLSKTKLFTHVSCVTVHRPHRAHQASWILAELLRHCCPAHGHPEITFSSIPSGNFIKCGKPPSNVLLSMQNCFGRTQKKQLRTSYPFWANKKAPAGR